MSGIERARLNVLQALEDAGAVCKTTATTLKSIDTSIGDLSRYARSSTKTMQSLLRDGLITIGFDCLPSPVWITLKGRNYLSESNSE